MDDFRRRSSSSYPNKRIRSRNSHPHTYDSWDKSRYDRSRYGSNAGFDQGRRFSRSPSARRDSISLPSIYEVSNHSSSDRFSGRKSPKEPYYEGLRLNDDFVFNQGKPSKAASAFRGTRNSRNQTNPREKRPSGAVHGASDNHSSYGRGLGGGSEDYDVSAYSREATLRRSKRKSHRAIYAVVAAVVAAALCGGVAFAYVNDITGNLHDGVDEKLRNALVKTDMANEPFYMLLLGTDGSAERDRTGELDGLYRSDTIILARIDATQNQATLVSIGRDTVVDLPGYGEQKINAAFGLGGPTAAVEAVSDLAGVPISHYAQVDFDGFSDLVDALGGVEVDVPMTLDDQDAGGHVSAGLHTLDGREALILCRARNSYADIAAHPDEMRAANQRLVLGAIARKMLNSDIVTIANSVQAISRYISTDLELTDFIGLAQALQGMDTETGLFTASAPTNSRYEDDIWYEYIDKAAWKSMMARVEKGQAPTEESTIDSATGITLASAGKDAQVSSAVRSASVVVKNGTDRKGLASDTRTKLLEEGFTDVMVGDIAEGYDYPHTLIIYEEPGQARDAQSLATVIGQGRAMQNDGNYLLSESDYLVLIGDDWVG